MAGDSTSQLVQITARDVGLTFTPSGNGAQDIRRLACEAFNAQLVTNTLWEMCRDFSRAIDEAQGIPESFKAIVSTGILRARSNIDLGKKQ
jgi:hypothetical protein